MNRAKSDIENKIQINSNKNSHILKLCLPNKANSPFNSPVEVKKNPYNFVSDKHNSNINSPLIVNKSKQKLLRGEFKLLTSPNNANSRSNLDIGSGS